MTDMRWSYAPGHSIPGSYPGLWASAPVEAKVLILLESPIWQVAYTWKHAASSFRVADIKWTKIWSPKVE